MIIYSLVARGSLVLCEYTESEGDFPSLARKIFIQAKKNQDQQVFTKVSTRKLIIGQLCVLHFVPLGVKISVHDRGLREQGKSISIFGDSEIRLPLDLIGR